MDKQNDLHHFFAVAKEKQKENLAYHAKLKEQEKEAQAKEKKEESKKRNDSFKNADPKTENRSEELYELIQKHNITIEAYEKNMDFDPEWYYDSPLEIYYCSKNNWRFKISNVDNLYIEEGIFRVIDLKHAKTEEEVSFYCDFGCRNTSESLRDEFLSFLSYESLNDYINEKYHHYLALPSLLRDKGYDVYEKDFSFGLAEANGYLELEKDLYVKVYDAFGSDFQTVVTNDKTWNVYSSNRSYHSNENKAYYFDYHETSDINEFVRCIEAFNQEQNGEIGYYDEDDGRYYSNEDVLAFYRSLRDKEDYYKEAWNHYHIRVEHERPWYLRGYDEEESRIVNKYKGLEIYVQTRLVLNDASQWAIGNHSNKSIITFEYDKRKSDQCRLHIENVIRKHKDHRIEDETKVGSFEKYGTFHELMAILKDYVYTMVDIHGIEL